MKRTVMHTTERLVVGSTTLLLGAASLAVSLTDAEVSKELWPFFALGIFVFGVVGATIR